jgi:putative ABC transport system ATP-binding protein
MQERAASPDAREPVVEFSGLSHWYGTGGTRRQVLFDLGLVIPQGEVVFLMGPSGCGKTTVLTLVGGLRSVQQGSVRVMGRELAGASDAGLIANRRSCGFIFQGHNLHRSLTALENVRMALEAQGCRLPPDADDRCRRMLAVVGLDDHATKRQDQLSGGQRQRVAIARALVGEPPLILADEPTAALDRQTGHDVVALMRRVARDRGMTVLMVTHDNRVFDLADRILEMEDGRIVGRRQGDALASAPRAGTEVRLERTT